MVLALAMAGGLAHAEPLSQLQDTTVQPTVTGRVIDNNCEPLIGASVVVKGTNVGTSTDIDGRFSIKAPQGSTLIVNYVGYHSREVLVNGNQLAIEPLSRPQATTVQPTVTGQVIDKNGEAVIGATVSVKGTNVTTVTDFDGRFSIKAPQGSTLSVS